MASTDEQARRDAERMEFGRTGNANMTYGSTRPLAGARVVTLASQHSEDRQLRRETSSNLRREASSGHLSVKEENSFESLVGIAPKEVHNAWILKVYSLLALELGFTTLICCIMMFVTPIRIAVLHVVHTYGIAFSICIFISMMGSLCFMMVNKQNHPTNMFALTLFVFIMSVNVGVVCCIYYQRGLGGMIALAAGITAVVFLSLTLYVWMSDTDFSYLQGFLFSSLTALIFMQVAVYFVLPLFGVHIKALNNLLCVFGIIVFCGYILYDTNEIKRKFGADEDDAIMASIELYLDILNLFLFILELLGGD